MRIAQRFGTVVALLGLMVLALGVGVAQAQAGPVRVGLREFGFTPNRLTATANQPITFNLVNEGQFPHSMRIAGPSGEMTAPANVTAGQSASWTVTLPAGTYTFWCPVGNHRAQGMEGTITVAGAQAAAPAAGAAAASAPGTLPRTGDADEAPVAPALALGGLALVALGLGLRRQALRR